MKSWLCPACPAFSVEEVAEVGLNELMEAEVDCPVPFPETELGGGGAGRKRPIVAPSRRCRERSPARKRAYSFGVCRSSMAIFEELKV